MVTFIEVLHVLFFYKTPKIVQIKSILVGAISRCIQLLIIAYIIGFAIVYKKGYQEFSSVDSSVTTKVKGVVYTNFSNDEFNEGIAHPEWYRRVWDVADYVVPPSENGATFIATNVIITDNQTLGTCPEDPSIEGALCNPDVNTCIAGQSLPMGNGVMTGNCISNSNGSSTCEIEAWCPPEDDTFPLKNKALLEDSKDFTILIKNYVDFPPFPNSNRRNIRDETNSTYLRDCHYDPYENKDCPIFRLGDIISLSGIENYNAIAYKGGIISIVIKWDCNFDYDKNFCFPTYDFHRLDDPHVKLAPGWNFRYANYYAYNRRTLFKMYGIRFSISVVGRAGKFAVVPLLMNVGAGLGLLALEVVVCDIIVLYIMKRRRYFKSKKFEEVTENEEESSDTPEVCVDKQTVPSRVFEDGYERLED